MKKIILLVFALVLLVSLFAGTKLFLIGEPADGNTLSVRVEEPGGQVNIYIDLWDSAMAISDISYRYDGTVLYMTVQKVLSSPLHNDGSKCIYYEITDETEIWVGGKLIWSNE